MRVSICAGAILIAGVSYGQVVEPPSYLVGQPGLSQNNLAAAISGVGNTVGRIKTISSSWSALALVLRNNTPSPGMSLRNGTPELLEFLSVSIKPPSIMVS